ncbi:hypothetical protein GR140_30550 (plasmid) [Pseudomonas putida]|uniref:hypothetical protein n=1 Tax=Pseudomonas putida TaxID=303 RepID=UPI001BB09AD9|nr:hypothetical protein [Pseudomonas putida]QUG93109.1 hypothetical protein GR140_30550 [Pseudomonas putida]
MRFDRYPRYEGVNFTPRKESAFARKLQREQDALPLFAEQVASEQRDWDDEKSRRESASRKTDQKWRDFMAKSWRKVRAAYYAMDTERRARCREYMLSWRGPCNPVNFIYIVEGFNGVREERNRTLREQDRQLREEIGRQLATEMRQQPLLQG